MRGEGLLKSAFRGKTRRMETRDEFVDLGELGMQCPSKMNQAEKVG